jgi:hypothetical protein
VRALLRAHSAATASRMAPGLRVWALFATRGESGFAPGITVNGEPAALGSASGERITFDGRLIHRHGWPRTGLSLPSLAGREPAPPEASEHQALIDRPRAGLATASSP